MHFHVETRTNDKRVFCMIQRHLRGSGDMFARQIETIGYLDATTCVEG